MPNLPNEEASCNETAYRVAGLSRHRITPYCASKADLPRIADDESRLQTGQN